MKHTDSFFIGAGSAFSGDRRDAAGPVVDTLIRHQAPACLIYETLAERTLALAQLEKRANPERGYEPWLDDILRPVLERCMKHNICIVGNFGAANPKAAALHIRKMARELGIKPPRVAVVSGDDVSGASYRPAFRKALGSKFDEARMVSANVYLGADSIADAIGAGAQIVVTGRVADSSLCVGPLMAHFGWARDDWMRRGKAVMVGHLLECGVQVTGGYFADPGFKDVPDLYRVGYPVAEVDANADVYVTKADNSGGCVHPAIVKEQLLYEIDNPAAYLAPDAVADITQCQVIQAGPDRVHVNGVAGKRWPDTLKVLVCQEGGWLSEGEISYSGPRAEDRARLAADIIRKRLGQELDLRIDLVGAISILADDKGQMMQDTPAGHARDVRLRVAAVHADQAMANLVCREVTALYTCGPAGGGGVRTSLRSRLDTLACYLPREDVPSTYEMLA